MSLVPPEAIADRCTMKRVVVHWTAGAYRASDLDRMHYHLLVEGDGSVVAGVHRVVTNQAPAREPRASHTLNCNTGSIGVAVCCMAGAIERPFSAGRFPMTQLQWAVMAEVVAELCVRYGIAVTATTVLAHGEVQRALNIPQRGKWDPLVLPWAATLPGADAMERFRSSVREQLVSPAGPIAGRPPVRTRDAHAEADREAVMVP
jgi:N-acetyl-anhydromuramyl-L-alanine amidase AmpD